MIAANPVFSVVLSDPYGGSGKGKKPEDLFCRCPQVLLRVLRIHGFFQCGHSPDNREECVDPGVIAGGGVFGDASGEGPGQWRDISWQAGPRLQGLFPWRSGDPAVPRR